MQVSVFPPGPRLAPFVRRFTVVETRAEATRLLLPEHGLVLGIRYCGSASLVNGPAVTRLADASLTGIVAAGRCMRTAAGSGVVLAAFREAGAARFFVEPLHELFGRTLALEDLVPRVVLDRVQQQVASAPSHARRIAIVEQFLWARLRPRGPDAVTVAAVSAIRRAQGTIRIAQLARQLGISQDPLEKRFRRQIGTSPKHLASMVRLRRVIDGAIGGAVERQRAGVSWSRLAIEAGYFDQSHFIREFRAVTGAAPAAFFRAGDYC